MQPPALVIIRDDGAFKHKHTLTMYVMIVTLDLALSILQNIMAGARRKRAVKEKAATKTESSSGQQSSGKESSLQLVTTRSSPQSLPAYDGNRDPNPVDATPVRDVITSANLRRLEMSFGMWATYRGVSTVPLVSIAVTSLLV